MTLGWVVSDAQPPVRILKIDVRHLSTRNNGISAAGAAKDSVPSVDDFSSPDYAGKLLHRGATVLSLHLFRFY